MQISVSIDAGDESVQFEFREGQVLASGDPTALVGKAIERLQALYPQGRGGVSLNKVYVGISPEAVVEKVAESTPASHYEHVHQAEDDARTQQEAIDEFDETSGYAAAQAVTTAQQNAGPAPWETQAAEAKAEQPAKPKRRSNEQLAADAGVDLDDVKEWKGGGRITKADIEEFATLHKSAVNNQTLDEAAQEEQGEPTVATTAPESVVREQQASPLPAPQNGDRAAVEPEETPEAEFANADDEAEEVDDGWKPPF
jgi:pyruvate/2-oxoglutarate dehydrogenase complex dihydrolipoamide acyltransferase (E2) component